MEMREPEEFIIRKNKLDELRELGINPYPYRYEVTHRSVEIKNSFSDLEGKTVRVAGRVMSKRVFGNLIFSHIRDESGEIQIAFTKKDTESPASGMNSTKFVKKYIDIGDFIGVEGEVFKTKTGEISVRARKLVLLAKGLRTLPEKWHGLKDPELKYRHRYLELISDYSAVERFKKISEIIQRIRKFFIDNGFWEIDTPILQPIYGGAFARPFETFSHALKTKLYLRISDELYLKRLLVGGLERVFEFSRDFRNEGIDRLHYPEFTILEAYAAYWDYTDMMNLIENLFHTLVRETFNTNKIVFQNKTVDFSIPFKRIDFVESLSEKIGKDILQLPDDELRKTAEEFDVNPGAPRHKIIDKLFDHLIGETIVNPTFVLDHPLLLSPLAKKHRNKPDRVERFELFVAGMELVNAFSELNDPIDQETRFRNQVKMREEGDAEVPAEIDEDFIQALQYGMPPAGGIGIGIERLLMLLLDEDSIRDVITFPQLRPKA